MKTSCSLVHLTEREKDLTTYLDLEKGRKWPPEKELATSWVIPGVRSAFLAQTDVHCLVCGCLLSSETEWHSQVHSCLCFRKCLLKVLYNLEAVVT